MRSIIPYRKPQIVAPQTAGSNSSFEENKNWISNISAVGAASAVAFLVPTVTLKALLLAGTAAVALVSPMAAGGLVAMLGYEALSGMAITKPLFAAAAFLATRWGLKTGISTGEEIVQTAKTSMKRAGELMTGTQNAANRAVKIMRSGYESVGNFFFSTRQLSAQPT